MMEHERLEEALGMLGELLAEGSHRVDVLVVGGASLLLLGLAERPTADVDIAAFPSPVGYHKADVLPESLTNAVADVADALGLSRTWLNNGPASLLDSGLPKGFAHIPVTSV